MPRYDILLMDVDGTVLDFLAAEKAAIQALFLKFGFGPCTDEMVARYSAVNVRYWEALERGELTKPEVLVGRFREFFALQGLPVEKAEEFNDVYQLALGDTVVFCDDCLPLLKQWRNSLTLAAVTNGTYYAQHKKLTVSGLYQVFHQVFISEKIGTEKPGKAFFEHVFRALDARDLSRVLIVGDSLTSDIRGGNNAGIDTCWYNPRGTVNDKGVTVNYEIRDLHELTAILNGEK